MFHNCKSLQYLNLSNFDTNLVTEMTNMFNGCHRLKYLNLKNSKDQKLSKYPDIFSNTPEKMIFCIDESKNKKLYDIIINSKSNSIIDCSDDAYIYNPEISQTIIETIINIILSSRLINEEISNEITLDTKSEFININHSETYHYILNES